MVIVSFDYLPYTAMLLKMGYPLHSFVYFHIFNQQTFKFLQQINVTTCPSSIYYWYSKPQPSEHESLPITTRPGLPPKISQC